MGAKTSGTSGMPPNISRRSFSLLASSMQFLLGLLLLLMGIQGMVEFGSSSSELGRLLARTFGNISGLIEFLIASAELVSGAVLIAALFTPVEKRFRRWAIWVILIVWLVVMFLLDIVAPHFGADGFAWLAWGQQLLVHGIILCVIISITNK